MGLGEKPFDWGALIGRARNSRVTLVDSAGFADPLTLARVVVALAGAGTLCAPTPWERSTRWLDPEFLTTLRVDLKAVVEDDLEWAAALAGQTRSAWLGHDLRLAWDSTGGGWEPQIRRAPMPSISLLFASKRPPLVEPALRRIAAQSSLVPEVILALHGGEEHDVDDARTAMSRLGLPGHCFSVDETVPLGAVLNVAAERSSGTHLAKWDDDDLYGSHHLEDLVVAMRRSGADLVGKGAEFVYFEATGETILRKTKNAEARSRFIAGAAMMIRRDVFFDAGGFPPLTHSVDYHLKERLRALGHDYFRTHGFGFVMTRTGSGHTREVTDRVFRSQAERTWQGIPTIAGVIA
jgi:hypothetical protein